MHTPLLFDHFKGKSQSLHKVCDVVVISCIDFRFQERINKWVKRKAKKYDRVALAGGVFDLPSIMKQVELSVELHKIKKVILMNHEDCGAYGKTGTYAKHKKDLKDAIKKIESKFKGLKAEGYYLHLDGTFEEV